MNLEKSVGTTKITKDTNIQMVMLTPRLTSRVNAQFSNGLLLMIDFVLFVFFVVHFNCEI